MEEIKKCDECGKPTTEIHQAADNSKEGEHFLYVCNSCWNKRIEDAVCLWASTPAHDFKSNFGMLVPKYPMHDINDAYVNNCKGDEWEDFKTYLEKNNIKQVYFDDCYWDLFVTEKNVELGRVSRTLQKWFDLWKEADGKPYMTRGFEIKNYGQSKDKPTP